MGNSKSNNSTAINWADNKVNVRVPNRADQVEIENAVKKINKEAFGGAQTVISAFMRSASVDRAREINRDD